MLGLLGGGGILPVDVDAVEAEVLDELDAALGEALAAGWGGGWRVEVFGRVGVRPAADGEEHFEVAVALFQQEELLDAAVDVGAHVVPRVAGVVLFDVGPGIRHDTGVARKNNGVIQTWVLIYTHTSPLSGRMLAKA